MRGQSSLSDKWFGFCDNFPGVGIFIENLVTGVMKNDDVSKIVTSHNFFFSK